MNLKDKIYSNIVAQLKNIQRMNDLRDQLREEERQNMIAVGSMNTLAELYQETTGRNLQQDINSDPEWKSLMDAARQEASVKVKTVSDASTAPARPRAAETAAVAASSPTSAPVVAPAPTAAPVAAEPTLRRVSSNKVAPEPQMIERTRNPVKISIDDNAPPIPAGAQRAQLDDLDDDDS